MSQLVSQQHLAIEARRVVLALSKYDVRSDVKALASTARAAAPAA
jgi:hypothetical protein